ncbi:hypothetical protein ABTX80_28455 [Streptomyces erythrochromogenes]|uniref:hypothetical protein n=1 Tax=Streptomyces erythrochromogenes TaxID=285574 RepID=UPI003329901F
MDWGTLLGTIVGATLGIGSTMLADRTRYRREHATRVHDTLRDLYSSYLAALNDSSSTLRIIILRESDATVRYQAALDAFRDASVLTQRYEIALQAPPAVREQSDRAYRLLRQWRDLLNTHPDLSLTSPEYLEGLERFHQARKDLQATMRASLLTTET